MTDSMVINIWSFQIRNPMGQASSSSHNHWRPNVSGRYHNTKRDATKSGFVIVITKMGQVVHVQ